MASALIPSSAGRVGIRAAVTSRKRPPRGQYTNESKGRTSGTDADFRGAVRTPPRLLWDVTQTFRTRTRRGIGFGLTLAALLEMVEGSDHEEEYSRADQNERDDRVDDGSVLECAVADSERQI